MCETQAHLLGVLRNTGMPISADQIVSDAYTTCANTMAGVKVRLSRERSMMPWARGECSEHSARHSL